MTESKLHRRARRLLRRGDRVGQPFGEALVVVGTEDEGSTRIKDGPARGREIDVFVEAPEGYWVGVEFNYRHKTGDDKIALLEQDGRYPILEVDLLERLDRASDDELRHYIAGCQECKRFNRDWLFLPSCEDICNQFVPEEQREARDRLDNYSRPDERGMSWEEIEQVAFKNQQALDVLANTTMFGKLRCCVPGCKGQVCSGAGVVGYYQTLPRFACSDHMGDPQLLTHPEGVQAFADGFPRMVADVVKGQHITLDSDHLDSGN